MVIKWMIISLVLATGLNDFLYAEESAEEIDKQLQEERNAYLHYREYVYEISKVFAMQMEKEFDLRCRETSGTMNGKIEDWGMGFSTNRYATIEEARALELLAINKFIQIINEDEKIKPYLTELPFKNVKVSISFEGRNQYYYDGHIYRVSYLPNSVPNFSSRNKLFYYSFDPFTGKPAKFHEEFYEEAVRLHAASPIKDPAVHQTTKQEKEMDLLLDGVTKEMQAAYGLERWSIGGKIGNGIEEIGAKFTGFQPASQEEARQLLLLVTEKLLSLVNNNSELRPYLKEYPFPPNRLKLLICFRNNRYVRYRDGSMESVILEENGITYFQLPPRPKDGELRVLLEAQVFAKESYQEALMIAENKPISVKNFGPKSPSLLAPVYNWFLKNILNVVS